MIHYIIRNTSFICIAQFAFNYTALGAKSKQVRPTDQTYRKGDIIGCALDLTVPSISFTLNGVPVKGLFKDFNLDGLFFPVVSMTACVRYLNYVFFINIYPYVLLEMDLTVVDQAQFQSLKQQ